jgi:hypothetical protein
MGNGISGYSGEILDYLFKNQVIVRGNTIPITLIKKTDGVADPITGYEMWMTFASAVDCDLGDTILIESQIPIADALNGVFSGYITDDETHGLTVSTVYVSIKYIDPDGQSFIFDMGKYKVKPCVNPKRALVV